MTDQLFSVMGVYAVTVVIMLMGLRWCGSQLDKKDAIIASKDQTIEKMLPVLTENNQKMAQVAQASNDLLKAEARVRARGARDE